jgi:hypothetical protein
MAAKQAKGGRDLHGRVLVVVFFAVLRSSPEGGHLGFLRVLFLARWREGDTILCPTSPPPQRSWRTMMKAGFPRECPAACSNQAGRFSQVALVLQVQIKFSRVSRIIILSRTLKRFPRAC